MTFRAKGGFYMRETNKLTVGEFRRLNEERDEIIKVITIDDAYYTLIKTMGRKLKNELRNRLYEIDQQIDGIYEKYDERKKEHYLVDRNKK